jgi:hypothetical protein
MQRNIIPKQVVSVVDPKIPLNYDILVHKFFP